MMTSQSGQRRNAMGETGENWVAYTGKRRLGWIDITLPVGPAAIVMVRTRSSGERAHAQEHAP